MVAPSATLATLFDRLAQLALQGPVNVVDAGNVFQGYTLSRALCRYSNPQLAQSALQRVMLSRVFTCYQMRTLLIGENLTGHPLLVLDFLSTFYDQSVHSKERRRLLQACIQRLQVISQCTLVAIWVQQRTVIPEDSLPFIQMLVDATGGNTWHAAPLPVASPKQLTLFPVGE